MTLERGPLAQFPGGPDYYSRLIDFDSDVDASTTLWTKTVVNSTAATAVNDANGGTMTNTNAAADNDLICFQMTAEPIRLNQLGKKYLFVYRGSFSEATQADFAFGLAITDTTIFDNANFATDIVAIEKNDGDANLDLVVGRNATAKADYTGSSAFATADTSIHTYAIEITLSPTVLGTGEIKVYIDGILKTTVTVTNLPHDEELAPFFGICNGEAVAKNMVTDFIGWSVPRG